MNVRIQNFVNRLIQETTDGTIIWRGSSMFSVGLDGFEVCIKVDKEDEITTVVLWIKDESDRIWSTSFNSNDGNDYYLFRDLFESALASNKKLFPVLGQIENKLSLSASQPLNECVCLLK